jgi:hypothetical protein
MLLQTPTQPAIDISSDNEGSDLQAGPSRKTAGKLYNAWCRVLRKQRKGTMQHSCADLLACCMADDQHATCVAAFHTQRSTSSSACFSTAGLTWACCALPYTGAGTSSKAAAAAGSKPGSSSQQAAEATPNGQAAGKTGSSAAAAAAAAGGIAVAAAIDRSELQLILPEKLIRHKVGSTYTCSTIIFCASLL